jgi:cysteine desulfurase family protein
LIYFDQAATSWPKPDAVVEAVTAALRASSASPGRSTHAMSVTAARTVFRAREAMAELLGVDDSGRIAFTLNVTQALNTVLYGLLKPGDHVLTTSMEHNSVMRPLARLAEIRGVEVSVVEADRQGGIDPDDFRTLIRPTTRLAVVNHGSNVTGTLAPLAEIKAALEGLPLVVDAAQTAGVLPLTPVTEIADVLAFTGHKGLMGPTGTGGLWVRPGIAVGSLIQGGTGSRSEHEIQPDFMPDCLEAGTPNTHGLAGLAAAVDYILEIGLEHIRDHETALTKAFLDGLGNMEGVRVYGPKNIKEITAVVSINIDGYSPSDLAFVLDREYGVAVRAGLHCAPRAHKTIGSFPQGTVRFSFGWFNTLDEVRRVLAALDEISKKGLGS